MLSNHPWCGGDPSIMKRWGYYIQYDSDRLEIFNNIPNDTDVLISHSPPFGILDKFLGESLGCPSLLKRVKDVNPKVHLFGHIHGGYGEHHEGDTRFYNCSNLDEAYRVVNPIRVISLCQESEVKPFVYETLESVENNSGKDMGKCYYCLETYDKFQETDAGVICDRCYWTYLD